MLDSFVLIAVAFAFLYFGYTHKDYATYLFSSMSFFLSGLAVTLEGAVSLGVLFIGYGFYIGVRSGIELIKEVFNGRSRRK